MRHLLSSCKRRMTKRGVNFVFRVQPILKTMMVRLKLPIKHTRFQGWAERCAIAVVRRALIVTMSHRGARIVHCEWWLLWFDMVVSFFFVGNGIGRASHGILLVLQQTPVMVELSVQHYFLTWTDLIYPVWNIARSLLTWKWLIKDSLSLWSLQFMVLFKGVCTSS